MLHLSKSSSKICAIQTPKNKLVIFIKRKYYLGRNDKTVYFDVLMSLPTNSVWLSSSSAEIVTFLPTEMTLSAKFSAFLLRLVHRRHGDRPFVLSPILSLPRTPTHLRKVSSIFTDKHTYVEFDVTRMTVSPFY